MRNRISIIATLAALATLAAGPTGAGAAVPRSITVSGTGIVTTVPNQASFTFGVTTNGHTAQAALSANSVQMNRLIAALKRLGSDLGRDSDLGDLADAEHEPDRHDDHQLQRLELGDRDEQQHRDGRRRRRRRGRGGREPRLGAVVDPVRSARAFPSCARRRGRRCTCACHGNRDRGRRQARPGRDA